ncbi:MAG: hypothetical protein HC898_11100 [Phycisphaerales bacterium]|nr:hypothetical protein [Phycisphaerales bacterium]
MELVLNVLTLIFLAVGLFFMAVGAIGLYRLPDLYNRMHATSKCVTLGVAGMLLAAAMQVVQNPEVNPIHVMTKVVLLIVFFFIAMPVGAHLLSKAAHEDGAPLECQHHGR